MSKQTRCKHDGRTIQLIWGEQCVECGLYFITRWKEAKAKDKELNQSPPDVYDYWVPTRN